MVINGPEDDEEEEEDNEDVAASSDIDENPTENFIAVRTARCYANGKRDAANKLSVCVCVRVLFQGHVHQLRAERNSLATTIID